MRFCIMSSRIKLLLVISFIALSAVKASSKYYDGEIRPYEFGYKIKDHQHRHEKKDANGLINGEFGFITGDGTYHSSVYATDENGNFKLLSYRSSYRIATTTTTTAPPTTSIPEPISREPKSLEKTPSSAKTCSHCKVIEKLNFNKPIAITTVVNSIDVEGKIMPPNLPTSNLADKGDNQRNKNSTPKLETKSNEHDNNSNNILPPTILDGLAKIEKLNDNAPLNSANGISVADIKSIEKIKQKHNQMQIEENTKTPKSNQIPSHIQVKSKIVKSSERLPKIQTKSNTNAQVPIEETNQRNGKTFQPSIIPPRLSSKKAINSFIGDVLYRFNYTAGYHGHHEEGDSIGNKVGGYFIVGRDNIRRGVIYVANENGFIPVVKYEKVSSADAPHEETEKNAGLRGYEFEWFHKDKSKLDDSSLKK